jgi:hypothetical protein
MYPSTITRHEDNHFLNELKLSLERETIHITSSTIDDNYFFRDLQPPTMTRVVSDAQVNNHQHESSISMLSTISNPQEAEDTLPTITVRPQDIICGRDATAFNHPGNRAFRSFIAEHLNEYQSVKTRTERGHVIRRVLELLQTKVGARFVKQQEEGVYVELSPKESREKVGHSLRDKNVFRSAQQPTNWRADNTPSSSSSISIAKAAKHTHRDQQQHQQSRSSFHKYYSTAAATAQQSALFSATATTTSCSPAEQFFRLNSPLGFVPINDTAQDLSDLDNLDNLLDFDVDEAAGGLATLVDNDDDDDEEEEDESSLVSLLW